MPTMTDQREWMTVAELAEHFGVGRSTVYAWNRAGIAPPSIKIGGTRVYRRADVKRWVAKKFRETT